MSYTTKNYTTDGGDKTVIGGTLEMKEGAVLLGLPKTAYLPDSTATTVAGLVTDFNSLLAKLKAAGLMKTE
ncbi:head fiber protein [Acetobacterium malicum]|uniref:head fiber protein n=1 Tax=Acetobacterium malicum TaxID=52692 RepID=UPI0035935AE4